MAPGSAVLGSRPRVGVVVGAGKRGALVARRAQNDDRRSAGLVGKAKVAVSSVALASVLLAGGAAHAELNEREYERGGEFNRGSAKQFGGIDMIKVDIVKEFGEDLRLSNFVQANIRFAKLRNANLRGAYMMKLVAPGVDFTGADMSDALMDRSVFVDANFTNAVLQRVVLTLSDLNGATIEGADFTDALLDKTTQQKLCETASGTNPVTGRQTRQTLKCGGNRFSARQSTPSRYMTDETAPTPKQEFDADRFSMYTTK